MPEQDIILEPDATLITTELPVIAALANLTPDQVQEVFRENDLRLLRHKRNQLLAESDWTQSEDVAPAVRDAWKPYRQSLRDITKNYSSLRDAVFPAKPE